MPQPRLPRELLSLVHYVELNKAGWWDQAMQRLVVAGIWLAKSPPTQHELRHSLEKELGVTVTQEQVDRQLAALGGSGEVVQLPNGRWKISEEHLRRFEADLSRADGDEREAREVFCAAVGEMCPFVDASDAWTRFCERFLIPLVRDSGARIYELLTGLELDSVQPRYADFLEEYAPEDREPMRKVVERFWTASTAAVRSHILRLLNGHFFLEASGLPQESWSKINDLSTRRPQFQVFVDTNFVFSVLNLHDNPSNEAAIELADLIGDVSKTVDVSLVVLDVTLVEATKAIQAAMDRLGGMVTHPNVAAAAGAVGPSGLVTTFMRAAASSPGRITAEAFFRPYRTQLPSIVRSRGMTIDSGHVQPLFRDWTVLDDIDWAAKYEQKTYAKDAKTEEQLQHDVAIWHYVNSLRNPDADSPWEARHWIVTLDHRFLNWDAYKRDKLRRTVPVCILPSVLAQLLQFWLPRDDRLENAVLSNLRLPFLFRPFDAPAERVTIRIIQELNRYEGIGDLPVSLVTDVLVDDALRHQIEDESRPTEITRLIRDALVLEQSKQIEDLEARRAQEGSAAHSTIRTRDETIGSLQRENLRATERIHAQNEVIARLERERDEQASELQVLRGDLDQQTLAHGRLTDTVAALEVREAARKRAQERLAFAVVWLTLPLLVAIWGGGWLRYAGMAYVHLKPWVATVYGYAAPVLLAMALVRERSQKCKAMRGHRLFRILNVSWKVVGAIIVLVLLPLAINWFATRNPPWQTPK